MRESLSVVIPTLNEAESLPLLLRDLARQTLPVEIIVADGGSRDATRSLAEHHAAHVIVAPRGRGAQMNAGARIATGSHLLFLHADTRVEETNLLDIALSALEDASHFEPAGTIAGHFPLRFHASATAPKGLLRFMEAKSRSNRRWTINGDQGVLIRRDFFARLGGYDESLPYFEDQRLSARIEAQGRWLLLPGELSTSFRRFEREGPLPRYALMALMMAMHSAGLDEFFTRAPGLYAAQHQAAALDLRPFVALARELLLADGGRVPHRLWRAGRFVRANAWQLALMAELSGGVSALAWFESQVEPRLDNALVDGLCAGLVAATVFGLAPGWLSLRERFRGSAQAEIADRPTARRASAHE